MFFETIFMGDLITRGEALRKRDLRAPVKQIGRQPARDAARGGGLEWLDQNFWVSEILKVRPGSE